MKKSNSERLLWQRPRNILLLFATLLVTQACVSTESDPQRLKAQIDRLYPDQSEEIREFFAMEAQRAGVKKIRKIKLGETPKKIRSQESGCGTVLLDAKLILINAGKSHCLRLAHLAHEITHIEVARLGCYGHGDKFYEYNLDIARRFEDRFSEIGDRGGWVSPAQSVENRSRYYRSDAEYCA